ncbi:hypothetical protein B0H11DRAFT_2242713 [Mycena galericulata]|nr:hypothetical protein B0H11DRAFT_2242713 [Mycena galericulata]
MDPGGVLVPEIDDIVFLRNSSGDVMVTWKVRMEGETAAQATRLQDEIIGPEEECSPDKLIIPPFPSGFKRGRWWALPATYAKALKTRLHLDAPWDHLIHVRSSFAVLHSEVAVDMENRRSRVNPKETRAASGVEEGAYAWCLAGIPALGFRVPATVNPIVTESQEGPENVFKTASTLPRLASPEHPALRALDNSLNSLGTPSPAPFLRPSSSSALPTFSSPSIGQLKAQAKAKPFKLLLLSQSAVKPPFASSPLNPSARPASSTFVTAGAQHPLAAPPIVVPVPGTPLRAAVAMLRAQLRAPRASFNRSKCPPLARPKTMYRSRGPNTKGPDRCPCPHCKVHRQPWGVGTLPQNGLQRHYGIHWAARGPPGVLAASAAA